MAIENQKMNVEPGQRPAFLLHRLVLWLIGKMERVNQRIEIRNRNIALRRIIETQLWLERYGYTDAVEALDPISGRFARETMELERRLSQNEAKHTPKSKE